MQQSVKPETLIRSAISIPFWRQMRWNLVVAFVALAVIPLVVVQLYTVFETVEHMERQIFNQLESVVELKQQQITAWLEAGQTEIDSIASDSTRNQPIFDLITQRNPSQTQVAQVNLILRQSVETHPVLREVFIYDLSGNVIAASDGQTGKLVSRQPYFVKSLGRPHYIEPPYYDVGRGQLVVVSTRTISDPANGSFVGVIASRLDIATLGEIMTDRTGLGETGETFLVSLENNYLLTPSRFDGYELNRAYRSEGISRALEGENGFSSYITYRNPPVKVLGVYRWLPELQVGMLAEVERSEALASTMDQTNISIGITILAAVLAAILGLVIATRIANPVTSLTDIATRIAQGDLTQRVTKSPPNELGVMAGAFNQMTEQLVDTIDKLDDQVKVVELTNKDLRIANAKVRESARLKSEFLATMSHELRTPLNAIIGFTGIMLEGMGGEMDEEAEHMLERVDSNSKRLLNLINDVLDIAKIEAGRMNLVSEPVKPAHLVAKWEREMSVLAQNKGIDFDVILDPAIPEVIYLDSERLTQIAANLLSNAFKFTEQGKVTLEMIHGGENWFLHVKDTGIGIPPHAVNYIFDEFRQMDGTTTRMYGGTGLGLAIVRNLCRMMGGTVHVESTMGKGSKFIVTLPLRVAAVDPDEFEPILELQH